MFASTYNKKQVAMSELKQQLNENIDETTSAATIDHKGDAPFFDSVPNEPSLSIFAVSAMFFNLFLATAPFSYPYGFIKAGPLFSIPLLIVTACISYVMCEFMIEVASISSASRLMKGRMDNSRYDELNDTEYSRPNR